MTCDGGQRSDGEGGEGLGGGVVWSGLRGCAGRRRLDGGVDGGQVDRPAAGAAGGCIPAETHVADMMVRLDGPVLADQAGKVLRGGVGAGEARDGVDGPAGGLCRWRRPAATG